MTPDVPNSNPFIIRPYQAGDETGLVELFHRAYGRPTTVEHWRWKLRGQASSVENVWLALSEDKPVFQYAGIPTRFQLSQSPTTVMVSVDTMTAPEFRRRGLLTQVAGRVYAGWRENGVSFVIGLPNQQWGSRPAALGIQTLFPLRWLVRPLRPEAIIARKLHIPFLKYATIPTLLWNRALSRRVRRHPQFQTEPMRNPSEAFDQLWERCKTDWMFSTIRDRKWVDWRFLASPATAYDLTVAWCAGKPAGYSAHTLVKSEQSTVAHLVDLFAARTDYAARDTLLCELLEKLRTTEADALFTLAVPGTPYFQWLQRAGFFPRHAFSVQVMALSDQLPTNQMCDPNNWNLTGADFDVI
jgi:hypothetical protein